MGLGVCSLGRRVSELGTYWMLSGFLNRLTNNFTEGRSLSYRDSKGYAVLLTVAGLTKP